MKTTIDIADALYEKARCAARERGVTIRALVENGLRHELDRPAAKGAYQFPDARVHGTGLTPEFANATWDQWLAEIYGERFGGGPVDEGG